MRCDLSGKVSLVTGAARGIGRSIADRFAANGSTVVYTDVDEPGCDAAATLTARCALAGLDVTRTTEIEEVIDWIVATCGRLDIVVNNAGVNTLTHRVTIDEFPRAEWDRILAVDLTGLYEVSRFAARLMRAQGSGRIINIASIVGLVPLRLQCAFVAAKAGVVNLTKAMALELGPHGILVNGIAPGSTLTEGTRQALLRRGRAVPRLGQADARPHPAGPARRDPRDRRRRAVPGRPGEQLHERPHPDRRRRLDGRLCPRILRAAPVDFCTRRRYTREVRYEVAREGEKRGEFDVRRSAELRWNGPGQDVGFSEVAEHRQ